MYMGCGGFLLLVGAFGVLGGIGSAFGASGVAADDVFFGAVCVLLGVFFWFRGRKSI